MTYLDSIGLSVLVRLARDAAQRRVPVRLVAVSERVEHLLDHTGVAEGMSQVAAPHDAR